ncbi:flagellar basal body-associated protein FliL [Bacillus fengqiuensis]|nr:flagellar basal body-associated protein FliL [Bacillus fengqiuensis]
MKKHLQNERGNIMLLSVCLMGVLVVMFLMLMSFVKAFYIKDKASSAAEQASLAATAYFYEKVDEAIKEVDQTLPGLGSVTAGTGEPDTDAPEPVGDVSAETEVTIGKKSLTEQIDEKTNEILQSSSKFTLNEARIEAIDKVLSDELTDNNGVRQRIVEKALNDAVMGNDAVSGLVETVSNVIEENGGTLTHSKIRYFNHDSRMEIQTSSTYKPTIFANLFPKEGIEVKQTGEGPRVGFIEHLEGFQSQPYSIE